MIRRLTLCATLAAALVLAGCYQTPLLYAPPSATIPRLDRSGEAEVGLDFGASGYNLRMAWSPQAPLLVIATGSLVDHLSDSSEHAYHLYGEGGIGLCSEVSPEMFGGLIAGAGVGRSRGFGRNAWIDAPQPPAWEESASYRRLFVQGSLAYESEDTSRPWRMATSYGVALRFAHLTLTDFASAGPDAEAAERSAGGWYFEPVVSARIGLSALQFETQMSFSSQMSASSLLVVSPQASVGLVLRMDRLW